MKTSTDAWKSWEAPTGGQSLRAWQAGRCASCGYVDSLVKDHCHRTGLVRGLLCRACNQHEGRDMGDWSAWRAGDNPAAHIGHYEVYVSIHGRTPVDANGALNWYTQQEREEWWDSALADLAAGGAWPLDAPWPTHVTERRRAGLEEATQKLSAFLAAAGWGAS